MIIYMAKMFATLLQAVDHKKEADLIFDFLRDICEDTSNWSYLFNIYDRMAMLLKKMCEYDKALIATKKML